MKKTTLLVSNVNVNINNINEDKLVDTPMSLFTSATEEILNEKNIVVMPNHNGQ